MNAVLNQTNALINTPPWALQSQDSSTLSILWLIVWSQCYRIPLQILQLYYLATSVYTKLKGIGSSSLFTGHWQGKAFHSMEEFAAFLQMYSISLSQQPKIIQVKALSMGDNRTIAPHNLFLAQPTTVIQISLEEADQQAIVQENQT